MKIILSWGLGFFALLVWCGLALNADAQTSEPPESVEPPLQITSDGANRYEGGIYYAEDNVTVTYGGDVLMADQVHFNPTTKEATAKGNVRLYMMDQIYRGDLLTYNFRTKKILSEKFRFLGKWADCPSWFFAGGGSARYGSNYPSDCINHIIPPYFFRRFFIFDHPDTRNGERCRRC